MSNNTLTDVEKIRDYFRHFLDMYVSAAKKANLPVNRERLQSIIDNAEFKTFERPYIFSVSRNLIKVNINKLREIDFDRINFLLLFEFARLDNDLFANQPALLQQLNEKLQEKNETGINFYFGIKAINEVLSQWICEELNDAIKGKKREVHEFTKGPLGSNIKFTSSFSNNDFSSSLELVVEKLLQSLGYKDIREFATVVLASDKGVVGSIQGKSLEKLCQIGIIYKAICKEYGLSFIDVSKEDVEQAYSRIYQEPDLDENSGGDGRL